MIVAVFFVEHIEQFLFGANLQALVQGSVWVVRLLDENMIIFVAGGALGGNEGEMFDLAWR